MNKWPWRNSGALRIQWKQPMEPICHFASLEEEGTGILLHNLNPGILRNDGNVKFSNNNSRDTIDRLTTMETVVRKSKDEEKSIEDQLWNFWFGGWTMNYKTLDSELS